MYSFIRQEFIYEVQVMKIRAAVVGKLYKEVKSILVENQNRICAYCESPLSCQYDDIREWHFHPKSDKDARHNWGLDWNNIVAAQW